MNLPAEAPPLDWPQPWVQRLKARLEALDGPLVQVWGWPGSGKRLLLRELARAGGIEVPPVALRDPGLLRRAVREARQAETPWVLCRNWPHAVDLVVPGPVLDELNVRPLLVFSNDLRQTMAGDSSSVLDPRELLLRPGEIASLWASVVGQPLGAEEAVALKEATDGWYQPLLLAAQEDEEGQEACRSLDSLLEVPSLRTFLAEEVLEGLAPERFSVGDEALLNEFASRGLVLGRGRRRRLPSLLEHYLKGSRSGDQAPVPASVPALDVSPPAPPSALGRPELTFKVRLFGTPSVHRVKGADGAQEVYWKLRRAFKMFAFLAILPSHRTVREDLVEAVFPDADAETIRRNFHPTLSYLRRSLKGSQPEPEVVQYRNGTYGLNPDLGWEIDTESFVELAEQAVAFKGSGELEAAAAAGRRAWRLYKGPFLHGFYDSWAVEMRETLHRTYLTLLRGLGEVCEALGRLTEALDAYRAVLVEDPLQESVQTSIMGIYASHGRRDLVRRQYDRLSSLLMEELGVEPLPQTSAEYHRLMG